ncbi:hypothetical protein C8Q69DRAFT_509513 [Paecilomyces variotii]|uniref:NAD-dependent epimerase/dehydratase domain-containing protein n=1 Tax=Byssochlamys spectabilis TaxID=264951 RepID=A0A443HMA4_BYSSP|nr:hypothetical protein C8Q69DRAFT_509513 [Paecilomyces variotii]KAJ9348763.1 hypothetical protein DTO280E4_9235 [Paecilomyces variotii]KAJ9392925.1 hypothetical protein DTO063F5_62 [Paecilomyces variotii]RWQ92931.1 hypothetical protein C8Q69DRAFT_509513 [Paecilomyces variotii]
MTKVFLTGASGFIGAHILNDLLNHGHTVVFAVRSTSRGQQILDRHDRDAANKRVSFVVIDDFVKQGAFDHAFQANAPFDAVIHTASPYFYNPYDPENEILQPAIQGTIGILRSVTEYAPSVKRFIITSSFAAMINFDSHPATYSESIWNPMTYQDALRPSVTYPASKKLAEKAAWDFMEKEKPHFSLTTFCPPLVFGPVIHHVESLRDINTSNTRIRDIIQGEYKDAIPPTNLYLWVDVRDLARAHIRALTATGTENERFFVTAGHYDNKQIVDIIREEYPHLSVVLPPRNLPGDLPKDIYQYDNSKSVNVLGLRYRTLRESIKDTVASLLKIRE